MIHRRRPADPSTGPSCSAPCPFGLPREYNLSPSLDVAQAATDKTSQWHCFELGTKTPSLVLVQEGDAEMTGQPSRASELAGALETVAQSSPQDVETTVQRR